MITRYYYKFKGVESERWVQCPSEYECKSMWEKGYDVCKVEYVKNPKRKKIVAKKEDNKKGKYNRNENFAINEGKPGRKKRRKNRLRNKRNNRW